MVDAGGKIVWSRLTDDEKVKRGELCFSKFAILTDGNIDTNSPGVAISIIAHEELLSEKAVLVAMAVYLDSLPTKKAISLLNQYRKV